jgi:S-adenosylmethionine synthetase
MARYIAKNLVAAGVADKLEVEIAYAIGVAEPVSLYVDSFGTGKIDDDKIVDIIKEVFPLKPAEIIKELDLKRPIYEKTARNGHFGNPDFPWEKLDKVDKVKELI